VTLPGEGSEGFERNDWCRPEGYAVVAFAAFAAPPLPAFSLRRAAQYFAILALTALRCAAVIFGRERPGSAKPFEDPLVARRSEVTAEARPRASSGKARRMLATSVRRVSRWDCAPMTA
jgi:hypothetical protein